MLHENIFNEICQKIGISPNDVKNRKCKKDEHAIARYMYFLYLKENTKLSLNGIGRQFPQKFDHSTVIHGLSSINIVFKTIGYEWAKEIYNKLQPPEHKHFCAMKLLSCKKM